VTGAPTIRETATASVADSLGSLHSSPAGLTSDEARARAAKRGENAVLRAGGGPLRVFLSQLASPLVLLLAGTAVVSLVLGQSTDAIIILVIVGMSVGFGFFNEFRSLQLVADLDRRLRRTATALRDGVETSLFALAIAVSLTPQLLPAIVTISLATGARRMARKNVLVKRLVSIEDLGNVEILFTDKTGTLTLGTLAFREAVDAAGAPSDRVFGLGFDCSANATSAVDAVGITDALDVALRSAPRAALGRASFERLGDVPFNHERRLVSVLGNAPGIGRIIIAKGAPESIVARCVDVPPVSTRCCTTGSPRASASSPSHRVRQPNSRRSRQPTSAAYTSKVCSSSRILPKPMPPHRSLALRTSA